MKYFVHVVGSMAPGGIENFIMNFIIKDSKIYIMLFNMYCWLNNIYKDSFLCRLFKVIKLYFYNCYIFKMMKFYENNLPIFNYSKIVNMFRKLFDNIMEFCRKLINSNMLFNNAKVFNSDCEFLVLLVAAYSIIDWFFRNYIVSFSSVWDEVFLCILYFVWIYKWVISKKKCSLKISPFDMGIILFIMVMFGLMLVSSNFNVAFQGFRAIVQGMFWYFVSFQLLNKNSVNKIVTIFVVIAGILSVYGIYQYIIGIPMISTWVEPSEVGIRTRVYSIFSSPNIFGCLLVMAIPMSLSLFIINNNICKKICYLFIFLFMCICVLFTYSRGAWIGLLAAMGIYILFKDRKLIILFLFILLMVFIFMPSIRNRFLYMFSESYISSSLVAGRMIRWIYSIEIWKNNFWIGLGLGNFGGAVATNNNLFTIINGNVVNNFYTDNYYLKILVESGIVGLLSFLLLMWQVVSISLKMMHIINAKGNKELVMGIVSGLIGVLIHCCVENVFDVPMMGVLFWLFVAVIAQLWYIDRKDIV